MALSRNEYDAVVLVGSWLIGFAPLLVFRKRWTWVQCVGLALLASPFVRYGVDISQTLVPLFTEYTVLQPAPRAALWASVQTRLLEDVAVPLVGLLLMHNAVPRLPSARAERGTVASALRAHGLAPRSGSWGRDALRGLALFFAIAAAYVVAFLLSRTLLGGLSYNGDESQYWRNITIPLIFLLSGVAGLAEEFLFRGVLLTRLARSLPWVAAALVQAVFFAFIHAGYGTWTHVAGPFVFGLGMAWVVRVLGVLPAALVHAEVNVMFFTLDVAPTYVAANGAWGALALGAVLVGWTAACVVALWWTRADAVVLLWKSLRAKFADVQR